MEQLTPEAVVPDPSEYAPYYGRYISLVPAGDIVATLDRQVGETCGMLSTVTDETGNYRYAPGKWSVKEMLGHVIDCERIFAYRALRIARHDRTPIEGFEQDDYVKNGSFGAHSVPDLLSEFACVRHATVLLFRRLAPEAWERRGIANNNEISVRAIAYIIAGHELHHRRVLEEKYFTL